MFSTNPFSFATFSSEGIIDVTITVPNAALSATGYIGTVIPVVIEVVADASLTATTTVEDVIESTTEILDSITGTLVFNTAGITVIVVEVIQSPEGVQGTSSIGTVVPVSTEILSALTLTSTVVDSNILSLSSVATAQSPISIEATSSIGTVIPIVTEILSAITATSTVSEFVENITEIIPNAPLTGTGTVASITILISSINDLTNETVSATTTIGIMGVNVVEFPTAITLTTTVTDVVEEAVEVLDNVTATTTVATDSSITATVFDFAAHANNYSKKRTVYISRAA